MRYSNSLDTGQKAILLGSTEGGECYVYWVSLESRQFITFGKNSLKKLHTGRCKHIGNYGCCFCTFFPATRLAWGACLCRPPLVCFSRLSLDVTLCICSFKLHGVPVVVVCCRQRLLFCFCRLCLGIAFDCTPSGYQGGLS